MKKKFSTIIASDIKYNHVFNELYYNDEYLCTITQERGKKNLDIEICGKRIDFNDFMNNLYNAANYLTKDSGVPDFINED